MPDILFQIGPVSAKHTLTGQQVTRLTDHAALAYAPETGTVALQRMMNDIIVGVLANTVSGERARAVKVAADAIDPIKSAEMIAAEEAARLKAEADAKARADAEAARLEAERIAAENALTPERNVR